MTTPVDADLPPLPKPLIRRGDFPAFQAKIAMDCYAATQMDAHAREAIAHHIARNAASGVPTERQFIALACNDVDGADAMLSVQRGSVLRIGRERWAAFLREGAATPQPAAAMTEVAAEPQGVQEQQQTAGGAGATQASPAPASPARAPLTEAQIDELAMLELGTVTAVRLAAILRRIARSVECAHGIAPATNKESGQ